MTKKPHIRPAVRRFLLCVADRVPVPRIYCQTIDDAIEAGMVVELRDGVPGYEYGCFPYRLTDAGVAFVHTVRVPR